ncbi:GNAT family N-acetyltransferase [Massilia sp. erpn]|uniref:GNAT family N-acetyltransferase n=1 Tax=Massilia sp. erpn TaxID=2738142 RepID=UPI0021032010|nr:GNAT family N-acetyltransferase [Massilia sp. erpn]UTY55747.1 GNAT family N-acetyltransferase [Massilia sp. erpn]
MGNIFSERLILRPWEAGDADALVRINADPRVTEFLLGPLSQAQAEEFIAAQSMQFAAHGTCLFAATLKESEELLGFIGVRRQTFDAPFAPCWEAAWRLAAPHWGRGYAGEGARAVLRHGFEQLGMAEVVAFTVPQNLRSRRVMEKVGMRYDPASDFAHPSLAPDHPLSQHVLYRISAREMSPQM